MSAPLGASGTVRGIEWATRYGPLYGCLNGYARLPEDHPWWTICEDYDDIQDIIDAMGEGVHGGITYGPDEHGWIGFDTAHYTDVEMHKPTEDPATWTLRPNGRWTPRRVEKEARHLARIIAEARCRPMPIIYPDQDSRMQDS